MKHHDAHVDLYGMVGCGKTKAEAKRDAESQIVQALDGSYTPRIFRFPAGYIGIVARCNPRWYAQRWEYFYLRPGEEQSPASPSTCSAFDTPDRAERALRNHVAQLLIGLTEDDGMSVLVEETDRRDHADYLGWQVHYKALRASGHSEQDAHQMARYGRAACSPAA